MTDRDNVCKAIKILEKALKTNVLGIIPIDKLSDADLKGIQKELRKKQLKHKIPSKEFLLKNISNEKTESPCVSIKNDETELSDKNVSNYEIKTILDSYVL